MQTSEHVRLMLGSGAQPVVRLLAGRRLGWLGLVLAALTARGGGVEDGEVRSSLEAALASTAVITGIVCAVDVVSIQRTVDPPEQTRSKELWRLTREGTTNHFYRRVFLPFEYTEEQVALDDGTRTLVSNGKQVALPAETLVPLADLRHLLMQLRDGEIEPSPEGGFVVTKHDGRNLLSARFSGVGRFPSEVTKSQAGALQWRWLRAGGDDSYVPRSDTVHLYRDGRIDVTLLRSFTNVKEAHADNKSTADWPRQEEKP